MYYVLMDQTTGSFYMTPGDMSFRAYSDPVFYSEKKRNAKLVAMDLDSKPELETYLYNSGFFHGLLDNEPVKISKQNLFYYDRNPNEIAFAQYQITKDKRYLDLIRKSKLLTLCKLENGAIYFPTTTIKTQTGVEKYVLAYTDRSRMPNELLEKYSGWKGVYMTFDTRCIVNEVFIAI